MTKSVKYSYRKPTFKAPTWEETYSTKVNGSKVRNVNYSFTDVAKLMKIKRPQFIAFLARVGIVRYEDINEDGAQRIVMNARFTEKGLGEMFFAQNKKTGQMYSQGVFTEEGMTFIEKHYTQCLEDVSNGTKLNVALAKFNIKPFTKLS